MFGVRSSVLAVRQNGFLSGPEHRQEVHHDDVDMDGFVSVQNLFDQRLHVNPTNATNPGLPSWACEELRQAFKTPSAATSRIKAQL
jgi:hypothetical protein